MPDPMQIIDGKPGFTVRETDPGWFARKGWGSIEGFGG
jgi:hypothetical protein